MLGCWLSRSGRKECWHSKTGTPSLLAYLLVGLEDARHNVCESRPADAGKPEQRLWRQIRQRPLRASNAGKGLGAAAIQGELKICAEMDAAKQCGRSLGGYPHARAAQESAEHRQKSHERVWALNLCKALHNVANKSAEEPEEAREQHRSPVASAGQCGENWPRQRVRDGQKQFGRNHFLKIIKLDMTWQPEFDKVCKKGGGGE